MDIPEWVILTGNVGFPIVITVYLLTRFEKRIEDLTQAIEKLESNMRP